jgi:hypothetical protein
MGNALAKRKLRGTSVFQRSRFMNVWKLINRGGCNGYAVFIQGFAATAGCSKSIASCASHEQTAAGTKPTRP